MRKTSHNVPAVAALVRRRARIFVKIHLPLGIPMCWLCLVGCHRSYQNADLVGAWQTVMPGGIKQTYTFSQDQTFTIVTTSSKDLRHFGNWVIDHDQLTTIVRSNSFSPTAAIYSNTVLIGKLTESVLILKDRNQKQ